MRGLPLLAVVGAAAVSPCGAIPAISPSALGSPGDLVRLGPVFRNPARANCGAGRGQHRRAAVKAAADLDLRAEGRDRQCRHQGDLDQ